MISPIIIISYTGAGKTTARQILSDLTEIKSTDTYSILRDGFAKENDLSPEYVDGHKAELRVSLRAYGDRICAEQPAALVAEAIRQGAGIVAGCRRAEEVQGARREFGAKVLWLHRPGLGAGSTDSVSVSLADCVVNNGGTFDDLRLELARWVVMNMSRAASIETQSGRTVDMMNPDPASISIADIAHSLSLRCRWGGHCRRFYSIAEHSIHVKNLLVGWQNQLSGLMHDSAEAYVCDCPSPLKRVLGGFREMERRTAAAISRSFEMPWLWQEDGRNHIRVADADSTMLATEAAVLMHNGTATGGVAAKPADIRLSYWQPEEARERFLWEFYRLRKAGGW